jgi:hypothetical protein
MKNQKRLSRIINNILWIKVAPAIEFLIKSYPHYVQVEELPLDDIDQKVN